LTRREGAPPPPILGLAVPDLDPGGTGLRGAPLRSPPAGLRSAGGADSETGKVRGPHGGGLAFRGRERGSRRRDLPGTRPRPLEVGSEGRLVAARSTP